MSENKVINSREVQQLLRVGPNTLYNLIKNYGLPCFKIGSDYRFNREELDDWRAERDWFTPSAQARRRRQTSVSASTPHPHSEHLSNDLVRLMLLGCWCTPTL